MSYSPREKAFHDGRFARIEGTGQSDSLEGDGLGEAWQEGWTVQDEIIRLRKQIPLDDALMAAERKFTTASVSGPSFDTKIDFLGHTINLWEWRRLMHRYGSLDATRLVIDDIMKAVRHRREREEYESQYRAEHADSVAEAAEVADIPGDTANVHPVSEHAELSCPIEEPSPAEIAETADTTESVAKKRRRVAAPPRAKSKDRR